MNIHMIDIHPDWNLLMRWASNNGLFFSEQKNCMDSGYVIHAWMKAMFNDRAPFVFRELRSRSGLRILGYSNHDRKSMMEYAEMFATPETYSVLDKDSIYSKAMPSFTGRIGFDCLAAPVVRKADGREIDVWEFSRKNGEEKSRQEVYAEWLIKHFNVDGAHISGIGITSRKTVKRMRKTQSNGVEPRKIEWITVPDVEFTGNMHIETPDAFEKVLKGIGRHKAFGYGMVLVRPA
ncbi:MAG: type I-E CRISPR-associated protein Cas6/Cse3/CasE [Methanobacteriota archaeon]|nr:MAG: type I-E CRISPR-associated protein Cas6/Cse3/CasE [Euryarchaeota archaeon]